MKADGQAGATGKGFSTTGLSYGGRSFGSETEPASPKRWAKWARRRADVAQLAERVLGKDEVTSSILVIGSRLRSRLAPLCAASFV